MTPEERALIDGLFDRMRGFETAPRDAEAQALIARRVAEAPYAPYALAQSVLVQEHALQQAYARIQELEARLEDVEARVRQAESQPAQPATGGFLGGLFGGGRASVPSAGPRRSADAAPAAGDWQQRHAPAQGYGQPQQGAPQQGAWQQPTAQPSGPWGQQPPVQQRGGFGGGGFLQGALATAAGVAGGALLFDGIKSMMAGGGGAIAQQAAEAVKPVTDAANSFGDLGTTAQNALGGQPPASGAWDGDFGDTTQTAGSTDHGGWSSDPQLASHDDGADWDGAGDDDDTDWA